MANMNFNKVILGGRLTDDVELRMTPSGVSVCSFTVAVNRKASKAVEQKADFINCVAWRNDAEFISKYFKKGSCILIVGEMQNRSWQDANGIKRYATDVVVDEAHFVESKSENAVADVSGGVATPYGTSQKDVSFEEMSAEDDLPFN